MADTSKASWITDHPFQPRMKKVMARGRVEASAPHALLIYLPPNPALCQTCNLAEAAHALSGEGIASEPRTASQPTKGSQGISAAPSPDKNHKATLPESQARVGGTTDGPSGTT